MEMEMDAERETGDERARKQEQEQEQGRNVDDFVMAKMDTGCGASLSLSSPHAPAATLLFRVIAAAKMMILYSSSESSSSGNVYDEEYNRAILALRDGIKQIAKARNKDNTLNQEEEKVDANGDEVETLRTELRDQRQRLKSLIHGLRDISQDVAMWGVREMN